MNDVYIEILVKRKTSLLPMILQFVTGALAVFFIVLGMYAALLFTIMGIGFGVITYFLHQAAYIEYEYLYVDKELSVDVIKAKSRRKNLASFQIQDMELFAPYQSHRLDAYQDKRMRVRDFSSHLPDSNPYAMILKKGNQLEKVILEDDGRLSKYLSNVSPRKVFSD